MAATVGIVPDLTETVTVSKKTSVPVAAVTTPKVGEIWPRGAKSTAG